MKRSISLLLVAALLLMSLAAGATAVSAEDKPIAQQLFELVNEERAKVGAPAFIYDAELEKMAQERAANLQQILGDDIWKDFIIGYMYADSDACYSRQHANEAEFVVREKWMTRDACAKPLTDPKYKYCGAAFNAETESYVFIYRENPPELDKSIEEKLFEAINKMRVKNGGKALNWDDGLAEQAEEQAADIFKVAERENFIWGADLPYGAITVADRACYARDPDEDPDYIADRWFGWDVSKEILMDASLTYIGIGYDEKIQSYVALLGTKSSPTKPTAPVDPSTLSAGDANGDSSVDMKDVLIMRKSIANMDVTIYEVVADVNGDKSIDMKDVLLLRKFIAGLVPSLGA